jgi:hypothetical protein
MEEHSPGAGSWGHLLGCDKPCCMIMFHAPTAQLSQLHLPGLTTLLQLMLLCWQTSPTPWAGNKGMHLQPMASTMEGMVPFLLSR